MFGYIKKDEVIALVEREVSLNREMHERYSGLAKANGESYEKEAVRFAGLAEEYFTRYMESKEILDQLNKL